MKTLDTIFRKVVFLAIAGLIAVFWLIADYFEFDE